MGVKNRQVCLDALLMNLGWLCEQFGCEDEGDRQDPERERRDVLVRVLPSEDRGRGRQSIRSH